MNATEGIVGSRVAVCSILLVALSAAADKPVFKSTWRAPDSAGVTYAGKKVVGLIVSDDLSLRMSAEEALARALTDKGVQGVAAYRVIPKEEIRDKDRARAWFERAGASAVVIMRLVDVAKETSPSVVVWQSGTYYSSLWSYYPYAWGATFDISPSRTDIIVAIETLVFDIGTSRMVWAATSESTNPEGAQALVKSIVDASSDRIRKDGLAQPK